MNQPHTAVEFWMLDFELGLLPCFFLSLFLLRSYTHAAWHWPQCHTAEWASRGTVEHLPSPETSFAVRFMSLIVWLSVSNDHTLHINATLVSFCFSLSIFKTYFTFWTGENIHSPLLIRPQQGPRHVAMCQSPAYLCPDGVCVLLFPEDRWRLERNLTISTVTG